jgi:hypothetical protein
MNDLDLLVEMFAKVGKTTEPVLESKKSNSVEYVPIVMEPNWLNDSEDATAPPALKRFRSAISNIGGGDINQLGDFIKGLNAVLTSDIDVDKHVEVIAKIDVIRTLLNLLGNKATNKGGGASQKGYQFEMFIAETFGGKVDTATTTNLADVTFEGGRVSLKFINPGTRIAGSFKNLIKEVDKNGQIKYIVGEKYPDKAQIKFYQFVFDANSVVALENTLTKNIKNRYVQGAKKKDGEFTAGTFSLSTEELKKIAAKDTFDEDLGTLDMSNAEDYTKKLFEALNIKFKDLFVKLQELNAAADRFKTDATTQTTGRYSGAAKAKALTTRKAGQVRKASQDA